MLYRNINSISKIRNLVVLATPNLVKLKPDKKNTPALYFLQTFSIINVPV